MREICSVKHRPVEPGRERARDTYGALAYLQRQPSVRADRIAVLGWSNGASTVLWAIGNDNPARPKNLVNDFRAAVAFYPGCRSVLATHAWVAKIPLLILVGEKDDWTPAGPCMDLAARAQHAGAPLEIIAYPGAFHGFDAPDAPLRVRQNVAGTRSGTATVGTDPLARADAIQRVPAYLAARLAP